MNGCAHNEARKVHHIFVAAARDGEETALDHDAERTGTKTNITAESFFCRPCWDGLAFNANDEQKE